MEAPAEYCIPWDPIPHEYSRLSDVGITHFAEYSVETTEGVACVVNSSLPADAPDPASERRHRWRISFPEPRAYRLNPVGEWPEALPFTWPPTLWSTSGKRHAAFWEIASSRYVAQSVDPDPDTRAEVHHYVLMNHDMAYEVIALGYRVEDLGE